MATELNTDFIKHMKLELFFKTAGQLTSLLSFLKPLPYQSFNLPNKISNENLIPYAMQILETIPEADVCIHYSLKNNKFRTVEESASHFRATVERAAGAGVREVLLVSGSGAKRTANSVSCLQYLAQTQYECPVRLGVAFNPYLTDEGEREDEMRRLKAKLESSLVSTVYLQFGSELVPLEASLKDLRSEVLSQYPAVTVVGSVFLPTKQLLNRMRFRPWKGLYLSPEFLGSVEFAEPTVRSILELYERYNVRVIVETAVQNTKEEAYMKSLLHRADAPLSATESTI